MCRLNDLFENGRGLSATPFKPHRSILLNESIGRVEACVLIRYLAFETDSYPFALAMPGDFLGLAPCEFFRHPNRATQSLRGPDGAYRPEFCAAMTQEQIRQARDLMTALVIKSAPRVADRLRLALTLLQEAGLEVQPGRGLGKLLATQVGASRETVSRELVKVKL